MKVWANFIFNISKNRIYFGVSANINKKRNKEREINKERSYAGR